MPAKFSKRTGSLIGFVDLGNVTRDIEQLAADDSHPSQRQLADQMLVFMAKAVFKPSLVVPVARFPSLCLTGKYVHTCVICSLCIQ